MSFFVFKCPNCGIELEADTKYIGQEVSCGGCEHHFQIQMETTPTPATEVKTSNLIDLVPNEKYFFLDNYVNVAGKKPTRIIYNGNSFLIKSWKALLRFVVSKLYNEYPETIFSYRNRPMLGFQTGILIKSTPVGMFSHFKFGDELFLETNFDANKIIQVIISLFKVCQVDYSKVAVFYTDRATEQAETAVAETPVAQHSLTRLTENRSGETPVVEIEEEQPSLFEIAIDEKLSFTLANMISVTGKKPVALAYKNRRYEVKSWFGLLEKSGTLLCEHYYKRLIEFRGKVLPGFTSGVLINSHPNDFRKSLKIGVELYCETNLDANNIAKLVRAMFMVCGIELTEVMVYYREGKSRNNDKSPQETATTEPTLETEPEVETPRVLSKSDIDFAIKVLYSHYPNGLQWNNYVINFLNNSVSFTVGDREIRELKRLSFKRSDGVYLFSQMVVDPKVLELIIERCNQYINDFLGFTLWAVYNEFAQDLRHLPDNLNDFRDFFTFAILPELSTPAKVFGGKLQAMCIPESFDAAELLEFLTTALIDTLHNAMDAMCIEELLTAHPYLNEEIINKLLGENPLAVTFQSEGRSYWKLIEFYYLPEDFQAVVGNSVLSLEGGGVTPSLAALIRLLLENYGESFLYDYDVDNHNLLRQIILKTLSGKGYIWRNNLLIKENSSLQTSVVEEFLQSHPPIFHEQDFFDYALENRGLGKTGDLIRSFLRFNCIRLSREYWVSKKYFEDNSNFKGELQELISDRLSTALGHNYYLPLGTLSETFFTDLPPITLGEHSFSWNNYLLASVAAHEISCVRTVNAEPSPYTVTAMVIPLNAQFNGDVLDYIFDVMKRTAISYNSGEEIFAYLKTNQIRMVKTNKIMKRIQAFWGVE